MLPRMSKDSRRPPVRAKAHALDLYNACARMLERLKLALYTAGSAIALTGAVRMLVLPHAVTAGAASLYIEREYLIEI